MPMDGYIRVSRVNDREGEKFISPKVQRERILEWARRNDVAVGEIAEELDVSGGLPPGERDLERLLRRCEEGRSQGIIVLRVDRFSRDALDILQAVKRLKECGARLVGAEDGVDSDRPDGQFLLTVLAGIAEQQRQRSRESWATSRGEARRRGVYLAGHPPTGYVRSERGSLVPDPRTAPVIQEAFKLAADGASYQLLADFLSDSGVLPSAGRRKTPRTRWSREGARNLIRNPVYIGRPNGDNDGADVEALVTPEQFGAAQHTPTSYGDGSRRARGMLVGLLHCGGCGRPLHVVGDRDDGSYVCRGKSATGVCPSRAGARLRLVDDYVLTILAETGGPTEDALASEEAAYLAVKVDRERAEAGLSEYMARSAELIERVGMDGFMAGLTPLEERVNETARRYYETPNPGLPDDAEVIFVNGRPMAMELWPVDDVLAQRRILRRAIEQVVLRRADARRRRWQPIQERVTITWRGGEVFDHAAWVATAVNAAKPARSGD